MPNNKKLLRNFKEILEYGYSKMSSFPFIENKYRLKKNILYMMMAATQSYSEAILRLMNNAGGASVYDKAAEVIYRSLVENYINLNFIYSERVRKRAVIFMAYSIQDKNDFAEKFKKLMLKYPKWNLEFDRMKNPKDWDKFIGENQKMIDNGEKKYKVSIPKKIPDLCTRAITHDTPLKKINKLNKANSLELYYVHYYKFFSQVSHLTMPGLERFYEIDGTGKRTLDIDGKPDSIGRLISITYTIYLAFLKFTLKKFGIYSKGEFRKFDIFQKSISK